MGTIQSIVSRVVGVRGSDEKLIHFMVGETDCWVSSFEGSPEPTVGQPVTFNLDNNTLFAEDGTSLGAFPQATTFAFTVTPTDETTMRVEPEGY